MLAEAVGKKRETDPAAIKGEALAEGLEQSPAGNSSSEAPLLSVADIRRQNEQQDQAQREEAGAYFAKGEEYQAAGKLGLAKFNYQRAVARDVGQVKSAALARWTLVFRFARISCRRMRSLSAGEKQKVVFSRNRYGRSTSCARGPM